MKINNTNVSFLTFEKSKGDWIKENKEPHLHYIETVYLNTKKSFYIIEAEKYFEDILKISFKSVIDNQNDEIIDSQYINYFILNTNRKNDSYDETDMLKNKKAAAYFDPWKYKIMRMQKGDVVYLYASGEGIIARGKSKGVLYKADYQGDINCKDEEYYVELDDFATIKNPLSAAEIKNIAGIDYVFMQTCFSVDKSTGELVWNELDNRI